jgi:ribosomal protein S18 acetylase RimI-like enzyme
LNARLETVSNPMPPRRKARGVGVSYRSMRDDDLPFLAALYRSTRETELARTSWPEAQKQAFIGMQFQAQHLHYQAHYPNALWLIVERNGEALGRLYLERWNGEHRIIDIALLPEARGGGIGSAILQDLIDEAGAAGKSLSIHVEKENPAMRLYRRLGFEKREDKGVYDLLEHPCTAEPMAKGKVR